MTALSCRVRSVAIPSRGGHGTATGPATDASGASSDAGMVRLLFALPAVYVKAALGLWNDPEWARRPYVRNATAAHAHDVKVARLLLARHGPGRLLSLFPRHAALLGIRAARLTGVTVTVVPLSRPALPSSVAAPIEAAELVEVAR